MYIDFFLLVQRASLCHCGRYVTASVYQMLRGAEILFSAIFAVTFLKRKLYKLHYIGIAFCLAGITMVGASSLLTPSGDATSDAGKVLLGMALIVVAQVCNVCPRYFHPASSEYCADCEQSVTCMYESAMVCRRAFMQRSGGLHRLSRQRKW